MAKIPRPSIADQLASIAANAPRDHVTEVKRDELQEIVLAAKLAEAVPVEAPSQIDVTTLPRRHLSTRRRASETPEGLRVRQRIEKPHASLYAHPRVFKKLREIAAAEDCKAHDLYVEGLRLVLARYGYDLDKLERGEA
jgi:hypothetical protein